MPSTEIAPRRGKSKRREFDSDFRMEVLEFLDRGGELECCRRKFKLTRHDVIRIIRGRNSRVKAGGRVSEMVGIANEHSVRTRLWDRVMNAVEDSLDPLEAVIKKSTTLSQPRGIEFLPTAISHLKNRGQNAIKVLEGIGDFRRAGDDIPKDASRRPLFNLPPGAHVAVTLDIKTQGGFDGSADSRIIEAERITEDSEVESA